MIIDGLWSQLKIVRLAAGHSVDTAAWQGLFDETMGRTAGRFGRVERRLVGAILADMHDEWQSGKPLPLRGVDGDAQTNQQY